MPTQRFARSVHGITTNRTDEAAVDSSEQHVVEQLHGCFQDIADTRLRPQGVPLYLMLTTLTEKGVQTLNSNPGRVREVNRDIEELGARIVHQWPGMQGLSTAAVAIQSLRDGRTYYRVQVSTTSPAHSEVVCQRARDDRGIGRLEAGDDLLATPTQTRLKRLSCSDIRHGWERVRGSCS